MYFLMANQNQHYCSREQMIVDVFKVSLDISSTKMICDISAMRKPCLCTQNIPIHISYIMLRF